jgi:hypothetical protein
MSTKEPENKLLLFSENLELEFPIDAADKIHDVEQVITERLKEKNRQDNGPEDLAIYGIKITSFSRYEEELRK